MIRTKGEAGTGNVVEAVHHQRSVQAEIRRAASMSDEELYAYAKEIQAPFHLLKETARLKRLPVVNFAAGGVATPADAALMMQLGSDGVFVGSGILCVKKAHSAGCMQPDTPLPFSPLAARAKIKPSGHERLYKPWRTTTTQRSWRASPLGWERPWSALPSPMT